jgi:hypothetical protein
MKDASETPKPFKRYHVGNAELKAALGIDWPGKILSVRSADDNGFNITMFTQPHELTSADRERLTIDTTIRIPVKNPATAPKPVPAKKWWRRA